MTNVLGYSRVSTGGQLKNGYSLSEQLEQIKQYCQENNYNLLQIFEDAGESGATEDEDDLIVDRDGLADLIDRIQTGDIRFIVVLHTNRLWRQESVKYYIRRKLKRFNVDIKVIDRPNYSLYTDNPTDVLFNAMTDAFDEYERLEIAVKMKRGRIRKASKGSYSGGMVPYGYSSKRGSREISVNTQEAEVVRIVFAMRREGHTMPYIADCLNKLGHTNRKGNIIIPMFVKRILDKEEFYRGIYKYAGITTPGQHELIL